MITFETPEEFDEAVMAVVERYLQIAIAVRCKRETNDFESPSTKVDVKLLNILHQTIFSDSGDSD